jgi:hypothetical protein
MMLKGMFGNKREEAAGGWRRLYNEELHNLHTSLSIIRIFKSRRMKWSWECSRKGKMRNSYNILVG